VKPTLVLVGLLMLGASRVQAAGVDEHLTVVVPDDLSDAARAALGPLQARVRVRVVVAHADEVPSRDEVLRSARRAYGAMSFPQSFTALQSAERALIADHPPSPARVARLAEVEAFYGACLLLSKDARAAEERFAFAKALDPAVRADPIFPPEVGAALTAAHAGPTLPLVIDRAPADARLWIDATPADVVPPLSSGLHYVAVERADRKPAGSIVRVSKSVTRVTWASGPRATAEQAADASADPRASDPERVAASALLQGPLWRVTEAGATLDATRYDARDLAHQVRRLHADTADPQALMRAICAVDACDAPLAKPAPAVWKRTWFWGVIGATAAVVVGAAIPGAVVGTRPRNYDAVVR